MFPKSDELIVLANDLTGPFAEVEGEGSLIGAEVVDVEDELLGQELGAPPHNPTNTRVDETILDPWSAKSKCFSQGC